MSATVPSTDVNPAVVANLLMTTPRDTLQTPYARGEVRSPAFIHTSDSFRQAAMDENRLVAGFSLEDLAGNMHGEHYLRIYQPDLYREAQSLLDKYNHQPQNNIDLKLAAETAKNLGVHVDGQMLTAEQLIDAKVNLIEAMQAATERATGKIYLLSANDFNVNVSGGLVGNVDVENLKSLIVDQYSANSRFALEQGRGNTIIFKPSNELVEFDIRGARLTLSMDDIIQTTVEKFQHRVPVADFNKMLQAVGDAQQAHQGNAWTPENLEKYAQGNIRAMTAPDVSLQGERSALDHITGKTREELSKSRHPFIEGLRSADARNIVIQKKVDYPTQFFPANEMPDVLDMRDANAGNNVNKPINLTPYSTPITDADVKRTASTSMANASAANSTVTRISNQQLNLNGYSTPITDVELARAASARATGAGKGGIGLLIGSGLALASGAASAYATNGDSEEKAHVFMKVAGNTATDIAPIVSFVKAQQEDKPNEAVARLLDWTPVGEVNRYAQRLVAFVTGKPTDVAPGFVEAFGVSGIEAVKNVAVAANEKLNAVQKALGMPVPLTPQEEFVKTAAYIRETGDVNINMPEHKPVALKAAVDSFSQLYRHVTKDGVIDASDDRALDIAINNLSKALGANELQGVVANYEARNPIRNDMQAAHSR